MKEIYFVRHGQTEWNAIARMQGQWNSDLSELGREHAKTNASLLEGKGIERLYVSPLDRTRQTAEIINEVLQLPVEFDDRIMEWDCGDWSGYLYAEVQQKWAEEWAAWEADRFNYRGPNCENYPDMFARARPFLDELIAAPEQAVAVVSHGMIGKVMVASLLELGEQETLSIYQPNDVVVHVALDSPPAVSHFVAGSGPFHGWHQRDN